VNGEPKKVNTDKEKIFINVICNVIIAVVVLSVFFIAFSDTVDEVFNPPSDVPIYSGSETEKNVSLSIVVNYGTEYIEGMLDILKINNVKATFFVGGSWADKNSHILEKIANGGHEIGNNGFFNKDHKKLSYDKNKEEIIVCERVIETVTGIKTNLFSPPAGSFGNDALKAAKDLGYKTVLWSKDTLDHRDQDRSLLYRRATLNAKGGDIILMHPTESTLKILDDVIKFYLINGYLVVSVGENIRS